MNKEVIRSILYDCGADVCGFAHISRFDSVNDAYNPKTIWSDCQSVIVFGIALPKGLFAVNSRLIYGHFNALSAQKTDIIALQAAREIEKKEKITVLPLPSDGPYEQWNSTTLTGHGLISVKHAAILAGIGSLGKSSLLLNAQYGNRLTLGLMLLDVPVDSDPLSGDLCIKNCRRCLECCPVGAIESDRVNQKKCRLNTYKKTDRGFETVECNRCRIVCPLMNGCVHS